SAITTAIAHSATARLTRPNPLIDSVITVSAPLMGPRSVRGRPRLWLLLAYDSPRQRHAPSQDDPDPFHDRQLRKEHAVARVHPDVAEIQMVRRYVYGHQDLGTRLALDSELLRLEPEDPATMRVLYHHDALEALLGVGRERPYELLDRRVDGPEHRDHHQPALRSRQQSSADDVRRHRSHRQH